jgi:hypothetical protein
MVKNESKCPSMWTCAVSMNDLRRMLSTTNGDRLFLVKPKIDGKPVDVTYLLNETGKLTMKFTAVPKPNITWHKADGSEITADERIQIMTDDNGQTTLTIVNATSQDAQVYIARATNKVGSIDGKVTLNVKGRSIQVYLETEHELNSYISRC